MQLDRNDSGSYSVGETWLSLLRHPVENLLRRWNWKSAVLSALTRGALFFFANLGAGVSAALGAMSIEAAFYITVAGFYGSATEAFRRARPAWLATLTMMFVMPALNHSLEFLLHWVSGTKKLTTSIVASISLSMISAVFNLFAMQRGAFIVGAERQSLLDDFRQLPAIVYDFVTFLPRILWQQGVRPQIDTE
ncbi:MAG: hypothetical protein AAB401_25495 [Acidobacteriota bacterium]